MKKIEAIIKPFKLEDVKDALAGVLWPLASQFHVTLMVNRGYSSQSAMFEAALRFRRESNDKKLHLISLGDHDPSGEDMVRDITDRMAVFGVEDLLDFFGLPTAAAYFDERTDYVADHIIEEAVGFDVDIDPFVVGFVGADGAGGYGADGGGAFVGGGGE